MGGHGREDARQQEDDKRCRGVAGPAEVRQRQKMRANEARRQQERKEIRADRKP